jgi:hypothetical protein
MDLPPQLPSIAPSLTSRRDFDTHQNQLRQWGMTIFDLNDALTEAVTAGRTETAFNVLRQLNQAVAQYRENSEFIVRELEATRTALALWSSHAIPNTNVSPMSQHATQDMATNQNQM